MVYQIRYTENKYETFNEYVKSTFKLNFERDCFVYFHYGEKAAEYIDGVCPNYLTAYYFIKDLENRFNVNINWFDFSFIFDHLKLKPDKQYLRLVLGAMDVMYINALETYCKNENKCSL